MQLQDVRTQVRQRMGLSTNDTAVTDPIIDKLLFAAQRKIDLMHDWPWLHRTDSSWTATVAGQNVYGAVDLASDWRKTLYIVVDDDHMLTAKQKQDIMRYENQTGLPLFYAAEGSEIVIAPTPDAAYNIIHEYIYEPVEVALDTAEFATYDWAIDLLVDQACILVARRLRDSDLARQFGQDFAVTYGAMQDEVRRTRQLPTPRHRNDVGWN